jgi:hypothetical protein
LGFLDLASHVNKMKPLEEGCQLEATAKLMIWVHLVGASGPRSAKGAKDAARLFGGGHLDTVLFVNRRHSWIEGRSRIKRAEKGDENLTQ